MIGKFYDAVGTYHFGANSNTCMAIESLERALTLSRSCGDNDAQCSILTTIAEIKWRTGHAGAAQVHANEARRLANFSGSLYEEAIALRVLAQSTGRLGDYRNSIIHLQRAQEILSICGMSGGILDDHGKIDLAEILLLKSQYTEARSIHNQIAQNVDGDPNTYALALLNIAQIDVIIGAAKEGIQRKLEEAKTIFRTVVSMKFYGITCCEMILADLKLREGDMLSAKHIFQDCLKLSWETHTDIVSFCLEKSADRGRWHDMEHTSRGPVVYLAHSHQSNEKLALHKAILFFGDVFISQGDDSTAHSLLTVALEGFNCMDVHHSRAQCLQRLGDIALRRGEFSNAAELWTAARPLFERSSQAKDVAHIDGRLAEIAHTHKALGELETLHPPETIYAEPPSEVEKAKIEEREGAVSHNSLEHIMISAM
jgi:tetratricopeptide (TPR) repeat protein